MLLAAAAVMWCTQVGASCYSIDPTDPVNYVEVEAINDRNSPVRLIICGTSCDDLHEERLLEPWGATELRVYDGGGEIGYAIDSAGGLRLGCLYLQYDHHVDNAPPVDISSMTACH